MDNNDMQTKLICPECGASIETNSDVCPECGFPLKSQRPQVPTVSKSHKPSKKQLGIAFCIVAVICFIIGITRVANDDYTFYSEHYQRCADGYQDAKREAARATGWLLKGGYEDIAEGYKDMMDDDMKELWSYRIQAIVLCSAGAVLAFFGIRNIRNDKEGSNATY